MSDDTSSEQTGSARRGIPRPQRWPSACIAIIVLMLLHGPALAKAATKTCLTGTDPSVANDLAEIAAVRAAIDATCPCSSYDGSVGHTHTNYVGCATQTIHVQIAAGNLRTQCLTTVKADYSASTCGVPAAKGDAPCITKRASGKVTCAIKPVAKCRAVACPSFTTCIDAADTNGNGRIDSGDSGACATPAEPTNTPTTPPAGTPTATPPLAPPTNTPPPGSTPTFTFTPAPPTATFTPTPTPCTGFCDNGDGTISDTSTGLMWEKKDQSGGIHDENNTYTWSSTGTAADGTAFTVFLATLNTPPCFAGHCDWRLPTSAGCCGDPTGQAAELESIIDTGAAGCGSGSPCVDTAFNNNCTSGCNVTGCSCTVAALYWSGSTVSPYLNQAWYVDFDGGVVGYIIKAYTSFARAVR